MCTSFPHNLITSFYVQRIENFSTIKGATLEILSQFALKNHASLSNLLEALNIMERHDVLYAISEKLKGLF
jgi:hypothetical protein